MALFDDDDVYEETLVSINECHVFKLPPRTSAEGYKAAEWENNHLWSGRCRVVAKGEKCEVRLEDPKTNQVFAVCPVNTAPGAPKAIEPVTDSSRYFVLRIEDNKGNHAFIGMGFAQRSEAFDFNVALQDHQKHIERLKAPAPDFEAEEKKDYSMKQGETIKVSLNVKTKDGAVKKAGTTTSTTAKMTGGFNGGLLPPPPGGKGAAPRIAPPPSSANRAPQQQQQQQKPSGSIDDFLSM